MATVIRAEISVNNEHWISKHRYYELKHFCLQYPTWKKEYAACDTFERSLPISEKISSTNIPGDPTAKCAIMKLYYFEKIKLIEESAKAADEDLYEYILKAVTENLSFTYLKSKLDIPCSRDTYYNRYRRFFWLLSKSRD